MNEFIDISTDKQGLIKNGIIGYSNLSKTLLIKQGKLKAIRETLQWLDGLCLQCWLEMEIISDTIIRATPCDKHWHTFKRLLDN